MLFLCDPYRIFLQLWLCRGLTSSTKSRENGSKGRIMNNQVSLRNIVKTKTQVKHPRLDWKSSYKKTFFWSCNWSCYSERYFISMVTGFKWQFSVMYFSYVIKHYAKLYELRLTLIFWNSAVILQKHIICLYRTLSYKMRFSVLKKSNLDIILIILNFKIII